MKSNVLKKIRKIWGAKWVQHGIMGGGVFLICGPAGIAGYLACVLVEEVRHHDPDEFIKSVREYFSSFTPLF